MIAQSDVNGNKTKEHSATKLWYNLSSLFDILIFVINLAYLYGPEYGPRRQGIFERATELGVRVFSFQTDYIRASVRDALALARPDACIVESDYISAHRLTPKDFPVPVVVCDLEKTQAQAGFTGIQYDREIASRKALDALFGLKLPNYGFVGYHRHYEWSVRRENFFRKEMKARGMTQHVLPCSRCRRLPEFMRALEKLLLTIPKPCGIFAVNDEIGEYVLTAANRLGIPIPDSLAVVAIDNDIDRCENTIPPLASVPPDSRHSGRLAVDFALKLIENPSKRQKPIFYGAGVLIARGSLRRFRRHDSAAAKALDFIRTHASDQKLDVMSVAKAMGLPLSTARLRFRKYSGHSIFEEIENQRFLLACSLLRNRKNKIGNIHECCGYGCAKSLCNVFIKRTGQPPSEWRAQHS